MNQYICTNKWQNRFSNLLISLLFALILMLQSMFVFSQNGSDERCYFCNETPSFNFTTCCPHDSNFTQAFVTYQRDEKLKNEFHKTMRIIANPSTSSTFSNLRLVTNGYQKKPFVLDSDIAIPIAIQHPKYYSTIHIIPRFKFRIFQNDPEYPFENGDESLPVRTPSAMPGLAYYFTLNKLWSDSAKISVLNNKFFGVSGYHHSNGQDGQELDIIRNFDINTYNGNFSENLVIEFIVGGRKVFESEDNPDFFMENNIENKMGKKLNLKPSLARKELYWKVGYEWHPKSLTNAVFDSINILSRSRLTYNITMLQMPTKVKFVGDGSLWCLVQPEQAYEEWRHVLNGTFALDRNYNRGKLNNLASISFFNLSKRLNINYTCYYIIGESRHAALFGQVGYVGSDDYNIYLNESYFNFRFGVAFAYFNQPSN